MAGGGGSLAVGGGLNGWRGVSGSVGAAGLEEGSGPAWWRGHLTANGSRMKKGGGSRRHAIPTGEAGSGAVGQWRRGIGWRNERWEWWRRNV
uniref:Uncharacterized protein n=1 Tax=Oryza sativa subsp. japonica TaxID=39947 RepID=Q6Z536_ORYSJ|nr:hypothetical protein [Oryza sativa Japonica Group]